MVLGTSTVAPTTPSPTRTTITAITTTVIELKENQKLFTHPVVHVKEQTTLQKDAFLEPMVPTDRLPGTEASKDRIIQY